MDDGMVEAVSLKRDLLLLTDAAVPVPVVRAPVPEPFFALPPLLLMLLLLLVLVLVLCWNDCNWGTGIVICRCVVVIIMHDGLWLVQGAAARRWPSTAASSEQAGTVVGQKQGSYLGWSSLALRDCNNGEECIPTSHTSQSAN